MKTILLESGTKILEEAIANRQTVTIDRYRLGSLAGFTPKTSMTNVSKYVYAGSGSDTLKVVRKDGALVATIELNANIGDFDVGNIILQDSLGRPIFMTVLDAPSPKIKGQDEYIGNTLVLEIPVKFTAIEFNRLIELEISQTSELPVYVGENTIPATPSVSPYDMFILYDLTTPILVVADHNTNGWMGNPHFSRLDSPTFGMITGGVVNDGYETHTGRIYNGGSGGKSSPTDYKQKIFGGDKKSTSSGIVIDGGSA